MDIIGAIQTKLNAAFAPTELRVADDSAPHYGHDGASPGSVSHVSLLVVSAAFSGIGRVERSRMVHNAIAPEIARIHAITALKTLTPEEFTRAAAP